MNAARFSLEVTQYQDARHWRWTLKSATGVYQADHTVALNLNDQHYLALIDLPGYLRHHASSDQRDRDERRLVQDLGTWIGEHVLGPVIGAKLIQAANRFPVVHVTVPAGAEQLLVLPLEIAQYGDRTLSRRGISYITEEYLPRKLKEKDWLE